MVHDGKPEEMFIELTGLESVVGQTKKIEHRHNEKYRNNNMS